MTTDYSNFVETAGTCEGSRICDGAKYENQFNFALVFDGHGRNWNFRVTNSF